MRSIHTRCCIAGGGPAGMMLGFLLARAGVQVTVLEKHADFLRDFRGDTVHPSTLMIMHELGLLERLLERPHQKVQQLSGRIAGEDVAIADFSRLPKPASFIALMPQWDFLDFVADHARKYETFSLQMESEVVSVIESDGRVVGVRAETPTGPLEVHADLVVAADGRSSVLRDQLDLARKQLGAPIDLLWMHLSRKKGDPAQVLGNIDHGHVLVMLDRGDYWQCAFVIPKGGFEALRAEGIVRLREQIARVAPLLSERVNELKTWQDVKLLTVRVDRLQMWSLPGLLCIGDAAHAMSPIGGVGINLAIQDAVAAANLLIDSLRRGAPSQAELLRVQQRRELPTRLTQWLQLVVQEHLISPSLEVEAPHVPGVVRLLNAWPLLRRLPARLVGLGFRPEHVSAALAPR